MDLVKKEVASLRELNSCGVLFSSVMEEAGAVSIQASRNWGHTFATIDQTGKQSPRAQAISPNRLSPGPEANGGFGAHLFGGAENPMRTYGQNLYPAARDAIQCHSGKPGMAKIVVPATRTNYSWLSTASLGGTGPGWRARGASRWSPPRLRGAGHRRDLRV